MSCKLYTMNVYIYIIYIGMGSISIIKCFSNIYLKYVFQNIRYFKNMNYTKYILKIIIIIIYFFIVDKR